MMPMGSVKKKVWPAGAEEDAPVRGIVPRYTLIVNMGLQHKV
jgi:hypothetical protein